MVGSHFIDVHSFLLPLKNTNRLSFQNSSTTYHRSLAIKQIDPFFWRTDYTHKKSENQPLGKKIFSALSKLIYSSGKRAIKSLSTSGVLAIGGTFRSHLLSLNLGPPGPKIKLFVYYSTTKINSKGLRVLTKIGQDKVLTPPSFSPAKPWENETNHPTIGRNRRHIAVSPAFSEPRRVVVASEIWDLTAGGRLVPRVRIRLRELI